MPMFQIVAYDGDLNQVSDTVKEYRSDSSAKSAAGRIAKRNDGPVDLARHDLNDAPWEERYMTTAYPSEWHATGYAFERLW